MKFPILLFCALVGVCVVGTAQIELTSNTYFPADQEFRELKKILAEESFEDPSRLLSIENGLLIRDVGFDKYDRRAYSLDGSGEVAVEVIALRDFRAAYSLLTLFRKSAIQEGPPGDDYAATPGNIHCIAGRRLVRIHGQNAPDELLKRIASSICNRIGLSQEKRPSLISHFPSSGLDASSLQYFPGQQSYKSYAGEKAAESLGLVSDAEIARANYNLDNRSGSLFLLHFPTGQVAEDYFSELGKGRLYHAVAMHRYAKKIGPIVALLNGPISPAAADKFLSSLRYSYSIRWVYEKRNNTKIIWGIPVSILGTVVRSLFFIAVLSVISVVVGAGFAVLRFFLRSYLTKNSPDRPEQDEITQLRLR